MDSTVLIGILIAIPVVIYLYLQRKYSYWARKGVPYIEPNPIFGNGKNIFTGKISYGEEFFNFYKVFKARGVKHGGVSLLNSLVYVPLDPELIKTILQKDFDHFMNRGFYVNEEADPLSAHLFSLEGIKWRNLRVKLTPTFTSGKMKMMFAILKDCAKSFHDVLEEYAKKREPLDIKDIIGCFTTDIIGSCAFGINCNSMKNPDNEFRIYGKKILELDDPNTIKQVLATMLPPTLLDKIRFSFTQKDVEEFFINIVRDTIDYRQKNNVVRKDFLQLMIEIKNTGKVDKDDPQESLKSNDTDKKSHLTINEIAAQCLIFFIAGFETSSTTSTFVLYELAVNQDIQEKLREEITSVLERHNNEVTYEAIAEMNYLEKVINETLRKYPPLPILHRICTKEYKLPGTDVVIEKGTLVQIPVLGLHFDEEYYPNPEVFDPERFNEENKTKRPQYTYLPFGEGPRNCIGLRFGKIQTKLGIITILRHFKVTLNEKTKRPLKMDPKFLVLSVVGGVWLNLKKID